MKIFLKTKINFRSFPNISIFKRELKAMTYTNIKQFSSMGKFNSDKSSNSDSKFPKEEENLANLLKDMDMGLKVEEGKNLLDASITQKNDIIFLSSVGNEELFNKIKLGDFIVFNNKYNAQCISIKESLIILILLDRITYIYSYNIVYLILKALVLEIIHLIKRVHMTF